MAIVLDGTTGITTPGLTNTGTETIVNLTSTGNTTLGDATTDTLTVGVTGIVKDSSGLVGIGTATPSPYGGALVVRKANTGQGVTNATAQFSDTVNSALWIGHTSGAANLVADQAIAFGYTNGTTTTERMRITSAGDLIVGGTSTSSNESTYQGGGVFVSRRASSAGTTHANFLNGGSTVGSITSNTTTTFYNTTSDYRLKENATPVTTGLQTIAALNPVNFNWVSNRIADTGFLAHEFQTVIPNSVMGTKDAIDANGNPVYQQIDRSGAIPFLVAAIQEQQALITGQQAMLASLTARITALETP